jgi:hypothetical protein
VGAGGENDKGIWTWRLMHGLANLIAQSFSYCAHAWIIYKNNLGIFKLGVLDCYHYIRTSESEML